MIGTISSNFVVGNLSTIGNPQPSPSSYYYGFRLNTGYYAVDTLKPGYAYWIKFDNPGFAIINAAATSGTPPGNSPGGSMPPGPVVLISPANFSSGSTSGSSLSVTFNWDSPTGNTYYWLEVSTSSNFSGSFTVNDSTITGLSASKNLPVEIFITGVYAQSIAIMSMGYGLIPGSIPLIQLRRRIPVATPLLCNPSDQLDHSSYPPPMGRASDCMSATGPEP